MDQNERDALSQTYFEAGWRAALEEVRLRGDRAVGDFLVEQLDGGTQPTEPECTPWPWVCGAHMVQHPNPHHQPSGRDFGTSSEVGQEQG